jgi:hypothetical protein
MSNIILAWNNQIDNATLTSDVTFLAALPLNNLKTTPLSKVARTDSEPDCVITATFAALKSIGCVMLCNHNLSRLGTARIKLYNGVTLLEDSGVCYVYPAKSGAVVSDEEAYRADFCHFFTQNYSADKVEITLSEPVNSYIQLGRVFAGEQYEPIQGIDYGDAPLSIKDLTETETTPQGTKYFFEQQKIRSVSLSLKYLSQAESLDVLMPLQLKGVSHEIVYSYSGKPVYTDISGVNAQTTHYQRTTFLGRYTAINPLSAAFFEGWQTGFTIEEIAI